MENVVRMGKWKINNNNLVSKLKVKGLFKDLGVDERIILKAGLKECSVR